MYHEMNYNFLFSNGNNQPSPSPRMRRQIYIPESKTQVKFTKLRFFKEVVFLIAFGIALPTSDVYSDVALIYQLGTGHESPNEFKCYSHVIGTHFVKNGRNNCDDGSDEYGK